MKKVIIIVSIFLGLAISLFDLYVDFKKTATETKPIANSYKPAEVFDEKLCNDAFSAFLHPHIGKAIDDWAKAHPDYMGGSVDPWNIKILSFERIPNQTSDLWFLIKVEVMPYTLAHISVGRDHITFMLKPTGEVTVEKLERIESYDYLKWRLSPQRNQ